MMLIRKTRFTYEAETRKNISNYLGTLEQYFSQFLVLRTGNLEIRRYAPFVTRFYFKKFEVDGGLHIYKVSNVE